MKQTNLKNINKYCYTFSSSKTSLFKVNKKSPVFLLFLGAVIGFINGFWGGGGGMLCVPTLTYFVGLEERKAHATTILIMLPLCVASFVMYLLKGYFILNLALPIGGGFVAGGLVGAYLLKGINNVILKMIFSIIILAGGIWLII